MGDGVAPLFDTGNRIPLCSRLSHDPIVCTPASLRRDEVAEIFNTNGCPRLAEHLVIPSFLIHTPLVL